MKAVAVVGGGITGLAAAYRLRQLGFPVVLFEKEDRTGGVIRSTREQGFLTESGPTSIRSTELTRQLVQQLGLESEQVVASGNVKRRFLVRNGEMHPVPTSPIQALTTDLLSLRGKVRVLAEPFIRRCEKPEPTLADFVAHRLGTEVLEYAVDPLVGGMYAGVPERLSVACAFPKLYALEQESGSLVRGALAKALHRKGAHERKRPPFSFNGGVQALTDALRRNLDDAVHTNAAVIGVRQKRRCWEVLHESGGRSEHAAVIIAAPAHKVARFTIEAQRKMDFSVLQSVAYSSVIRVLLGFRSEQLTRPLDGFGFLVPRREKFALLGSVFCSSVYGGSAPEGHVSFLCFLGGARRPEVMDRTLDETTAMAIRELKQVTGIVGDPVFQSSLRVSNAIPQYGIGHGNIQALLDEAERQCEGLFFAGNYRSGIAVSDALESGWKSAENAASVLL